MAEQEKPITSIRHRRAQRRRSSFFGREGILQELDTLASSDVPVFNIINIFGIGGIGKSQLLKALNDHATQTGRVPMLSSLETAPTALSIVAEWRDCIPSRYDKAFSNYDRRAEKNFETTGKIEKAARAIADGATHALDQAGPIASFVTGAIGQDRVKAWIARNIGADELAAYQVAEQELTDEFLDAMIQSGVRPLFMLDTYELASIEIDEWLREDVLGSYFFSETWLAIVAGQDSLLELSPRWRRDWQELLWHRELEPLSHDAAEEFLRHGGVEDPDLEHLVDLTNGLPWALQVAVETYNPYGGRGRDRTSTDRAVVSRILSQAQTSPRLLHLIEASCVLEWFDLDLLRELSGIADPEIERQLFRYSFVRTLPDGKLALHDVVRRALASLVKAQQPDRWQNYTENATRILSRRLSDLPPYSTEWFLHFQALFLIRAEINPQAAGDLIEMLPLRLSPVLTGPLLEVFSALERRPGVAQTAAFLTLRGQVDLAKNRPKAAVETFEKAVHRATALEDRSIAWVGWLEGLHRLGRIDDAIDVALQALTQTSALDVRVRAFLAVRLAEMYGIQGRLQLSHKCSAEAESHLEHISDADSRGHLALLLSHVYIFMGDYEKGRRALDGSHNAAREANDEYLLGSAASADAWLSALNGELDRSWAMGSTALSIFVKLEDSNGKGLVALSRADLLRKIGDLERAVAWNRYARRMMEQSGSSLYVAIADTQLAQCLIGLAEPNSAREILESALATEQLIGERLTLGTIYLLLSATYDEQSPANKEFRATALDHFRKDGYYGQHQAALLSASTADEPRALADAVRAANVRSYYDLSALTYVDVAKRKLTGPDADLDVGQLADIVAMGIKFALRHHLAFALEIERSMSTLLSSSNKPTSFLSDVLSRVSDQLDAVNVDALAVSAPIRKAVERAGVVGDSLWILKETSGD
jgi:tetratricopeptide (TPR) repeat protein